MKKLLALSVLLFGTLHAQNLDSLYSEFLRIRGISDPSVTHVLGDSKEPVKCSFGIVNNIKSNFSRFTPKQKSVLAALVQRPTTDTSFVSPSGKFRIHFNKTGSNALGYDLKEFAKAADSSYNYEVNILKYPAPPADNGLGGDDRCDIYIQDLGYGNYGETVMDENDKLKGPSFITIENDFAGCYTNGIPAASVTIAHELHHAIQMGNYIFRAEDLYFYEITSTSMEEFVFDEVNDYYNYIPIYFRDTDKALARNNGYNLAIWNIFLRNRFGDKIIKDIWEAMPNMRAVEAFSKVLSNYDTSLKVEFNRFGLWCYFTNARAVPGKYFEEAANYPLVITTMTMYFSRPTTTIKVSTAPVSNNFYEFIDGNNRLFSIITNVDVHSSVNSPTTEILLDYSVSSQTSGGYRKLHQYYSKITSDGLNLLAETNIFNDIPLNEGNVSVETAGYAYPQPFKYSEHQYLFLPASLNGGGGNVNLYIYSTDMNLVYSGQKRIVATEKIVVPWDAKDSNQHKLATGVYFYVIKCGEDIIKGKFVIYND
ncbi:MAG: hypothetical protein FD122_2390 [Stygiobacter sp.]|nr:MAG: hypothetical protein FD122_2390 [Stygiobacter sp.]KAF0215480.1 MAG: hypothetical protein FD178_1670 [Ignavibacteria bacterium]